MPSKKERGWGETHGLSEIGENREPMYLRRKRERGGEGENLIHYTWMLQPRDDNINTFLPR